MSDNPVGNHVAPYSQWHISNEASPLYHSQNFINWGQRIKIHEPMGAILIQTTTVIESMRSLWNNSALQTWLFIIWSFWKLAFSCDVLVSLFNYKQSFYHMYTNLHVTLLKLDSKTDSPGDLSHLQLLNPDTVVDASKCLLTGAWYSSLLRGSVSASQMQRWMLPSIHLIEHRIPN